MRNSVLRNGSIAAACGLFIAGCTSTPPPEEAMPAGPPPNVAFYNAAPPGSQQLGPFKVSVCNGTRPVMTRKVLDEAARLGGDGVTQLTCRTEDTGSCSRTSVCEGVAINTKPPPPPPPPPRRRRR